MVPWSPIVTPLVAGFLLGGGLIVAIGAQNAFVLRQGIRKDHVLAVTVTCVACDWTLMGLGGLGFGTVVATVPALTMAASLLGAAFLLFYGATSFRSALRPGFLEAAEGNAGFAGTWAAVAATLGVSLLNPHVYLDTVVLVGSVAARYEAFSRAAFVIGAGTASLAWFFGIGFGARLLAPIFARPAAWRALDVIVGVVMWGIAASLVMPYL